MKESNIETESLPMTTVSQSNMSSSSPVPVYLAVRFFTIVFYFLSTILISKNGIYFVVMIIIEASQFWFIKNISGLHLVGLKWFLTIKNDKGELFHYYSRPPPYIPVGYQTNTFWFGFFFSVIFWGCSAIIGLIVGKFVKSFTSFCVLAAEIFNLVMFTKAHGQSKAATENDVLAKLLDNPIASAQLEINPIGADIDQKEDVFDTNGIPDIENINETNNDEQMNEEEGNEKHNEEEEKEQQKAE